LSDKSSARLRSLNCKLKINVDKGLGFPGKLPPGKPLIKKPVRAAGVPVFPVLACKVKGSDTPNPEYSKSVMAFWKRPMSPGSLSSIEVFKVKLPVAPFPVEKLKLSRAAVAGAAAIVPRTIVAPTVATTPMVGNDCFIVNIILIPGSLILRSKVNYF
jgi:hypothetical protein